MVKICMIKLSIIMVHLVPLISGLADEFMSCDRYFESRRESRILENIPCDITKVTYCGQKGPAYPEAAIWRFKEENRALMRRMYGDMDSTSLCRQMKSSMSSSPFPDAAEESESDRSVPFGSSFLPDLFTSLEYNIRMGSGLATAQGANKEPSGSHQPVGVARIVENGVIKVKRKVVKKKVANKEPADQVIVETSTTTSTSSVFATTSESPSPASTTSSSSPGTSVPNPTTTMHPVMTTQPAMEEEVTLLDNGDDTTTTNVVTDFPVMASKENIHGPPVLVDTAYFEVDDDDNEEVEIVVVEDPDDELVNTDPGIDVTEYVTEETVTKKPMFTGESQNACPVDDNNDTPYWVKNLNGKWYSLLQLPPFEQYIRTQKCKYENEQGLCRKGCRCEQQYTDHKLLVFDPENECRGIFSDFFRFPTACVCKCYHVLLEEFLPKRQSKSDDDSLQNIEVNHKKPDNQHQQLDPATFQNIPAFFPYEAKEALLRELRRKDRRLSVKEANAAAEVLEEIEQVQVHDNDEAAEGLEPSNNNPFKFSYVPIMEFNLANGDKGSVGQTPRK